MQFHLKALVFKQLPLVIASLFVAACTSTAVPKPDVNYAGNYSVASTQSDIETIAVDSRWWKSFQSAALNELMQAAQQQSPDLLISAERVKQAELQMRIANASLFPSLSASASSGESRSTSDGGSNTRSESTRVGANISYEVDLWGGIAAERASAKAGYDATRYDQDAATLSIKAAIASGWFQWLALQERIATAHKNIAIAERVQKIVDARYNNGAATAADVAQQKTNLLTQRSSLLPLELQARQTQSALAILLGKTPQEFSLAAENLLAMQVPQIAAGTPADLVARRPDLAASEADLRAANANIHAARAALLPGISFGANAGKSASELFSLNPATQTSGWTLSLAQTLFNGGRLVNQKRLTEARQSELLLQYHKAILTALQEVDNALVTADISQRQETSQQEIVANAERSLRLTEARYRAGTDDLLSLLDAQRSLFQVQDSLVQQRLSRLNAAVDLYKALGGGWQLAQQDTE
ncbi:efflux transporter outer membrane subunit [Cellvibrio fibrivorans]|uniref:NodT family efflux transporter outer membrane factor (OMF) lipoprotein n=1 Tax=Cellvibrio fibrivorans TaxID=126350 RepID=A0ABU1V142_9GAMM|nr:efflux transporter outer membrane subunit [Cellvibrio fibrivorans]MDR7091033.1 NodT family efflux transporter outer membrane factor (OMF) lipoprotein [Cellvibrio fibrivorans]